MNSTATTYGEIISQIDYIETMQNGTTQVYDSRKIGDRCETRVYNFFHRLCNELSCKVLFELFDQEFALELVTRMGFDVSQFGMFHSVTRQWIPFSPEAVAASKDLLRIPRFSHNATEFFKGLPRSAQKKLVRWSESMERLRE